MRYRITENSNYEEEELLRNQQQLQRKLEKKAKEQCCINDCLDTIQSCLNNKKNIKHFLFSNKVRINISLENEYWKYCGLSEKVLKEIVSIIKSKCPHWNVQYYKKIDDMTTKIGITIECSESDLQ